jgi:hypothetical protein
MILAIVKDKREELWRASGPFKEFWIISKFVEGQRAGIGESLARLGGFSSLDERFYFFSSMISGGGSAKMGVNRL